MKTNLQIKISLVIAFIFMTLSTYSQGDTEIWGMTYRGGATDVGTIFKTDENGTNLEVQHDFFLIDGFEHAHNDVIEASNGKFYGMAPFSNSYIDSNANPGLIFEYDPITELYTKKFEFLNANDNGDTPFGSFIEINNKLYGMTLGGGLHNDGVIFEYDPLNDVYNKLYDFNDDLLDGKFPHGNLIQASNGNFYGMTYRGGANNDGVIFEFDFNTNTYTKKIDFDGDNNFPGSRPHGNLFEASNGKLYGMTEEGGINDSGVFFEYDIATNTINKLADGGSVEMPGTFPLGDVVEGPNNSLELFGLTAEGGQFDYGTMFKYDINTNNFIVLEHFGDSDPNNLGFYPGQNLTLASNDKLYGLTSSGGTFGIGSLFEYDPVSNFSIIKYNFNTTSGFYPENKLYEASDGKFYSIASTTANLTVNEKNGVLFSFDKDNNSYEEIFEFNRAIDGSAPEGSLIYSLSNQKFYGLTSRGGINESGSIFEFDPITNQHTKLFDFDEYATQPNTFGALPSGSLVQATNGNLYGTTTRGGINNFGVLFEFNPVTLSYTKRVDFIGVNGSTPYGNLLQASNGKLYGTTSFGGEGVYNGINVAVGVLFEFDIASGQYTKIHDFNFETGGNPYGGLVEAANGKLYGMTSSGLNDAGVIFEYSFTSGFQVVHELDANELNGKRPYGNLIQYDDNTLFGVTSEGGINDDGVIFKFNIATNTLTKQFDFNKMATGGKPSGSPMKLDNKLYGLTSEGGLNDFGTVFQFDPQTSIFTKTVDFGSSNGSNPAYTTLVALDTSTLNVSDFENDQLSVYPNPTKNFITIKSDIDLKTAILYDILGNKLLESKNNQIDVSAFKSGMYLLKIRTNKGSLTKKIIINH